MPPWPGSIITTRLLPVGFGAGLLCCWLRSMPPDSAVALRLLAPSSATARPESKS